MWFFVIFELETIVAMIDKKSIWKKEEEKFFDNKNDFRSHRLKKHYQTYSDWIL